MFTPLERLIKSASWLEHVSESLQPALQSVLKNPNGTGNRVQDLLNGTWLGHPLHPALVEVPIGAWTCTAVLDVLALVQDDEAMERAADITLATGWLVSLPSAVTGWSQWTDTYGKDRRLGLLHGMMMGGTVALYTSALISRMRGSRSLGVTLSMVGWSVMGAGAYLGGEETYTLGYGVNRTAFEQPATGYVSVIPEQDLQMNKPVQVDAKGTPVMLVKLQNGIFALGDTCTHAGCSLSQGKLDGMSVICSCHGSQFDLRDGEVMSGPATYREPHYHVRVRDGNVEVKHAAPD